MKATSMIILAVVVLLLMSGQSFAQMGGNPQDRLKRTMEDYKTRLKLTETQIPKVDSILTAQMNDMTKIREAAGEDRQAMREKMQPLREKTDQAIEALLTDDQKKEFKKILEERAQRMQQRGQ